MSLYQRLIHKLSIAIPEGRNRRLVAGVASGVITKGSSFLITLISVPMTLHYLGSEQYGIWVTMISMLAWISMVDLGVANGLTPLLSAAFGTNRMDLARGYVATAFWSLIAIAVVSGIIIALSWDWIDWSKAFNIQNNDLETNVSISMALAVGIFLINLPLSINQRIYFAYQEGVSANLWQFLISISGLIGIYFVTNTQGGLVYLVLGYSGSQLLVNIINSLWLFFWAKPQLNPFISPNFSKSKNVLQMGGLFFINQIATLLIFQKDNIIISHYLGPNEATPYSITWQMFLYLNFINLLISPYLGPALGEAYAKGDLRWMRKIFIRYLSITCIISLPVVTFMAWFHRPILAVWVGSNIIPTTSTVVWIALWTVLSSVQWPIITLLNNTGKLRTYTIYYGLAAVLNLLLSIIFIKFIDVAGGVAASVITVVGIVLLPSLRELSSLLKINK